MSCTIVRESYCAMSSVRRNVSTSIRQRTLKADLGATGSSPTLSVTVRAIGHPPIVSVTSPTSGASFTYGASVQGTARAAVTDDFVSPVKLLDKGALISSEDAVLLELGGRTRLLTRADSESD